MISKRALFLGFLEIGMMGFGGVALVARHVIVTKRAWVDDREYAALLGFGQILPGANITNIAIILGWQHGGVLGVLACLGGMLAVPLVVLVGLFWAYGQWGQWPQVTHALAVMAAAGGGMLVGTGVKSFRRAKLDGIGYAFAAIAMAAVVVGHVPMVVVLLALVPVGIGLAWKRGRPS